MKNLQDFVSFRIELADFYDNKNTVSLFSSLDDLLNQRHPLYKLSHKINWGVSEDAFTLLYCYDNGRPAKPIRLTCGLLILKHLRNVSDKLVVEQWSENSYFQCSCGMQEFIPNTHSSASELVHFRKRIGEKGIELAESIRVNDDKSGDGHQICLKRNLSQRLRKKHKKALKVDKVTQHYRTPGQRTET